MYVCICYICKIFTCMYVYIYICTDVYMNIFMSGKRSRILITKLQEGKIAWTWCGLWRCSTFLCVLMGLTLREGICDMTYFKAWHESFGTCLSFLRVAWLIHIYEMMMLYSHVLTLTHSYVWLVCDIVSVCSIAYSYARYKSIILMTKNALVLCASSRPGGYLWHDSFLRVTCLVYISNVTHSTWLIQCDSFNVTHYATSLVRMHDTTHSRSRRVPSLAPLFPSFHTHAHTHAHTLSTQHTHASL